MNKDALLASGIGFGVGLLITGTVLLGPNILSEVQSRLKGMNGDVQSATQTAEESNTKETASTTFTIREPEQDSIIDDDSVTIRGSANAGSLVVFAGDEDEAVTTVSEDNSFEGSLSLKEGKNDITITNIDHGTTNIQRLVVFYTQ